jgi:hypothetical protein
MIPVRPRQHTELLLNVHKKLRHCADVLLSSLQYLANTDLMGSLTLLKPIHAEGDKFDRRCWIISCGSSIYMRES